MSLILLRFARPQCLAATHLSSPEVGNGLCWPKPQCTCNMPWLLARHSITMTCGCQDEESNPGHPGSETSALPLGHRPSPSYFLIFVENSLNLTSSSHKNISLINRRSLFGPASIPRKIVRISVEIHHVAICLRSPPLFSAPSFSAGLLYYHKISLLSIIAV